MSHVYFNKRVAIHKDSNARVSCTDLCYAGSPVSVVAYNSMARASDAVNCSQTVFINDNAVCSSESRFSRSTGSESSHGGIHSGTRTGEAVFLSHSSDIYIDGIPAVRAGDLMISNHMNSTLAPVIAD